MSDLLAVAAQELQVVEGQLAALKVRAEELRSFIKVGTGLAPKSANGSAAAGGGGTATAVGTASLRGVSSLGAVGNISVTATEPIKVRAIRGVLLALRDGQPKTARQLVQELAAMGITIGGQDPASNLSAILSQQRTTFRNSKGEGYVLVEPQKTEPGDAVTSSGSSWFDPSHAPGKGTATAAD